MDTLIYPHNKTMYLHLLKYNNFIYLLLISILYYVYAINPSHIIVNYTYCVIL